MSDITPSWNFVEIDLAALRHNFTQVQKMVGLGVQLMAVVKSDAYGHGLVPAAKAFQQAGAATFGVAEAEEGVALRQAGITGRIVVLLGIDQSGVDVSVAHELSPVVYDLATLRALSRAAEDAGRKVGVHVKVDTGMGRLGIKPAELPDFLATLHGMPALSLEGVLSHVPKADMEQNDGTEGYRAAFAELWASNANAGAGGQPVLHIANSACLLRNREAHFDMVRPGISLYGCYPSAWLQKEGQVVLKPAMSFKSRVIQVKEVPAGYGISYGHRFVTHRPTRLAVLPAGYADGYLRRMAGKAQVLIAGRRVPIVGTICMNACMADITDLPAVQAGDEAVFLGSQGKQSIGADEIAQWSDTIHYEILYLFGSCNRQVYIDTANIERC